MLNTNELQKLSIQERLSLLDAVWKSLEKEDEQIESPDWHKTILEKRLNKIADGQAEYITLDQLKNSKK